MKAVDILINSLLPSDLRDYKRPLDKKHLDSMLAECAQRYPDQTAGIIKKISDVGREASYAQGETITLDDMRSPIDKEAIFGEMDNELGRARSAFQGKDLVAAESNIYQKYSDRLTKETIDGALATGNNIGNSVISGARGNPSQLRGMLTTPAIYTDYKDKMIPMFVRHSFGEGLRPAEYLASTFGVRKSIISTKVGTAKGGALGKQFSQNTAHIVVSQHDCGTSNGLDMDVEDPDIKRRVLARDEGGVAAGTMIDRHVIGQLRKAGVSKVIVRSPLTCQAPEGICAECHGAMADYRMPKIGYVAGSTAGAAAAEPLAQGALNCLVDGTMVRMADGSSRAIDTIQPGEMVLGSDMLGHTTPVKVTAKWDQGTQPCFRYTYRMGSSQQFITLESTSEHPLLCNKKSYGITNGLDNNRILKLKAGHAHKNLAAVMPVDSKWYGRVENYALLLGVMLGDGIRCQYVGGLTFSCADPKLIEDLSAWGSCRNLRFVKRIRSYDWGISMIDQPPSRDTKTGRMLGGLRNPMKSRLERWGLLDKYAHEKRMPQEVWGWDRDSVVALVAGYLATDGSVYQTAEGHVGIGFSSTSRGMLEDFKQLLAVRLCIYSSSVSRVAPAGQGAHKHDAWSFSISRHDQLLRFRALIAAVPGIKEETFDKCLGNITYKSLFTDGMYRAKRIDEESIGPRHCWDLTVDNSDHLFVLANGIIVSNTKHTAGALGGVKKEFSGLDAIRNFTQTPETFPDRAAVAEEAGKVSDIKPAPQGGTFITVGDRQHYALPGFEPTVKVGDSVEQGDILSDGLADPHDIVRLRGLGEGRKYYMDRLSKMLEDSGTGHVNHLNAELITRGTLDNVRITNDEGLGNYLPDDVANYSAVMQNYSPPADTDMTELKRAEGKYLQQPVLHYTVGTQLTPKMLKHIGSLGFKHVATSATAPGFAPEMVRLQAAGYSGDDWMAKLNTSRLSDNLSRDASRARDANVASSINFAPRLAKGEGFGENINQTGKF